jgi:uncharacterized protein YigE (DUF2233 family)
MLRPMSTRMALAGLLGLIAIAQSREVRAVDCRTVTLLDATSQNTTRLNGKYTVCPVDLAKETLRLHYTDAQGERLGSFAALQESLAASGKTLAFAMNAGMFHPDFKPVGLLVIDGKTISPINRRQGTGNFFLQPNGVFMLDESGARVLSTQEFVDLSPRFATQSGPMLVHGGEIPAIPAFMPTSRSRHIRNGVCVKSKNVVAFVISETPVSLYEFARFFQAELACSEALYLDGTISSLFAPKLKRADDHAKLGPMFAVTE